ncbi:FHA domain containing protein [Beutenbergia cavernae DSM 12333]|uniref:FHA domain containing protein n=1 Tax=Beutenbergia cavernae (strain ATCC BAA-8 / DSM 12333 / CCUG 43141 / JCM 11478 / NBRC 16432 / NCIMB 13614 / HKI 0122) TaxID=471853 RepID=C5C499_BEUC1|nr:FHA domain-containing protein [Beutenbergia cavernae]ACQ80012.1 FHA domain containing protein [Beutenbergia cavernae DSM 12333]
MRPRTYVPGTWTAMVAPQAVVVLDPSVAPLTVLRVWDEVEAGSDVTSWVELLAGGGLAALPAFALVQVTPDGVRALLRGDLVVEIDGHSLDARDVATWREQLAPEGREIVVRTPEAADGVGDLPLEAGVVRAAQVQYTVTVRPTRTVAAPLLVPAELDADGASAVEPESDDASVDATDGATTALGAAGAVTETLPPVTAVPFPAVPAPEEPVAGPEAEAESVDAVEAVADGEPEPERDAEGESELEAEAEAEVEPEPEPEVEPEPEAEPEPEPEPEPENEPEPESEPEPENESEPEPAFESELDVELDSESETELEAVPEPEPEPEPVELEPETEPEPADPEVSEDTFASYDPDDVDEGAESTIMVGSLPKAAAPGAMIDSVPAAPAPVPGAPPLPTPPPKPSDAPAAAAGGDHDGQTLLAEELPERQGGGVGPAPEPESAAPPAYVLSFAHGARVDLDRPVLVGRAPESPRFDGPTPPRLVPVPSPEQDISRTHAEIRVEGGYVIVTDLRSTNGTVVTRPGQPAQRLHPGEGVPIPVGTEVDLGDGAIITLERGAGGPAHDGR